MKYLINDSILFDAVEYQLSVLDAPSSLIKLSTTSGRVLAALIISHGGGHTVSREWLFEKVWINHGLQPSNGNLNQQISLIRKALAALGLDGSAIVTVPKRGLKLNYLLMISIFEESALSTSAAADQYDECHEPLPADLKIAQTRSKKNNIPDVTLAISLIVTLLMISIYFIDNDKQPLLFLDQAGACDVYTLRPIAEREKDVMMIQLKQSMKGNIEKCAKNDVIIFSYNIVTNSQVRQKINQRKFLAKCERDGKGNLSRCLTFYFYNWAES